MRLSPEDRRARFMHEMSEQAIRDYAGKHNFLERRIIGWFHKGKLRAAVEIGFEDDVAEVAVTVEEEFRGAGVASRLMKSALRAASNRGVRKVIVRTSTDNDPMLNLARGVGAHFTVEEGGMTGEIEAEAPTPVSIIYDLAEERNGFIASFTAAVYKKFFARWAV